MQSNESIFKRTNLIADQGVLYCGAGSLYFAQKFFQCGKWNISYSTKVLYSRDDQGWWVWFTKKSTLAHLQELFMAT